MLDTMTTHNHRDFASRYAETYGFLTQPDKPRRLVYISDVTTEAVYFRQDDSDMQFHANCDSGVTFDFIPVDHGWYNTKKAPLLFERVPARQWKRGISRANTTVYSLRERAGYGGLNMDAIRPSFTTLNDAFVNAVPYHFDPETKYGCAFSKHFVLTAGKKVMFYRMEIGVYDNKQIILDNDTVLQEVRDALRRCGVATEVVTNG